MWQCQVCEEFRDDENFFAYRYECTDCREARKKLKRDGVTFKAIKEFLKATGHVEAAGLIPVGTDTTTRSVVRDKAANG